MPPKSNASGKDKSSSAKKRHASKGPEDSAEATESAPAGRSTVNSQRAAGLFPPPSPSLTPIVERHMRLEAFEHCGKAGALPGSTGRPMGRSRADVEYPAAWVSFTDELDMLKLRTSVECYLLEHTKQRMYFSDVLVLVQVPGSKMFGKHTIVDSNKDIELLVRALYERPEAPINVHIQWNAPSVNESASSLDSAAAASPSSASATQSNNTSHRAKKRRSGAVTDGLGQESSSVQEILRLGRIIAGQLHESWQLCDKCKRTGRARDSLCWFDPQHRHYHLTHHSVSLWAEAIRTKEATYDSPPERMLPSLLDAPPTPRGVHASQEAGPSSGYGNDSQPFSSPTAANATTSSGHVAAIDLTGSPPPPSGRTPFADASRAANATLPNAVQAGRVIGPAWPLLEWARRAGDHHVALAQRLFDQSIDSMKVLARTLEEGAGDTLQLTRVQLIVLDEWVNEWKLMEESFEDYRKRTEDTTVALSSTGGGDSA